MPMLSRNTRPCLTIVNGKRHAAAEDYEDPLPRRHVQSEPDIDADPLSSDDDGACKADIPHSSWKGLYEEPKSIAGNGEQMIGTATVRSRGMQIFQSVTKKSESPEAEIFEAQRKSSTTKFNRKGGYTNNIHTSPQIKTKKPIKKEDAKSRTSSMSSKAKEQEEKKKLNIPAEVAAPKMSPKSERVARIWIPEEPGMMTNPKPSDGLDKSSSSQRFTCSSTSSQDIYGRRDFSEKRNHESNRFVRPGTPLSPRRALRSSHSGNAAVSKGTKPSTKRSKVSVAAVIPTPPTTQTSRGSKDRGRQDADDDLSRATKRTRRDSTGSSELSPTPSSTFDTSQELRCKMCDKELDPALLIYLPLRPDIRDLRKFCRTHKQKEADEEWKQKGYPNIDWDNFSNRLGHYDSDIQHLIDQPETSHYRQVFKTRIGVRGHQSLAHMEETDFDGVFLGVGYYGTRGLMKMLSYLFGTFPHDLRRQAVGDMVMSAQDVPGYVRNVLAPELATLLIKDDMGVGIEKAREILQESMIVGEEIHGKEEDDLKVSGPTGPYEVDENGERVLD